MARPHGGAVLWKMERVNGVRGSDDEASFLILRFDTRRALRFDNLCQTYQNNITLIRLIRLIQSIKDVSNTIKNVSMYQTMFFDTGNGYG